MSALPKWGMPKVLIDYTRKNVIMKATETNFLNFLKKSPQFIIPIYQRTYSWTEHQCLQLWDDILRTGSNSEISAHFVGSIVYIEQDIYQVSSQSSLLVIDGQQRLTTITLILEALAQQLGDREPLSGFSAKKLRNYYLLNNLEEGEDRFKLLLTQTDKDSLLALIQQKPWSAVRSSLRIAENFTFFQKKIKEIADDLSGLCRGLAKLVVVDIALSRNQDNPQLIFESMNSTGLDLSQADLIRNFILMSLGPDEQNRLYTDYWRPMEIAFGQEGYSSHFDRFMRDYLTLKTGDIPNRRAVYKAFKSYASTPEIEVAGIEALVEDIHTFSGYYCAMELDKEPNKQLAKAFRDLRELEVKVVYPFLLELYDDFVNNRLTDEDFESAVRLVEAYVFRRKVCNIPTNSLNTTFTTFGRSLKKDRYLESIKAHFLTMPSYRRFPKDEEFKREFVIRDLYHFKLRSYWLRRLENYGRKEYVPVEEYTIEHILPQNENLSSKWKNELGPEWERVRETWLHTLGNLTLTGYNSEYSDRPFAEKRDMEKGFRKSPLKVNEDIGNYEVWDEIAIKARADRLASMATRVWAVPSLSVACLQLYRARPDENMERYTIDDHSNLAKGSSMRDLFNAFRKQVLLLDPCVREDFLKLYVAYKAETNFVDVVPLKNLLRLTLNMQFAELRDPKSLAKDVTNKGRWGNGDIEIEMNKPEELPYVMGLVRQALEKQMGNGG